jgi:hypothetical protein
MEILSLAVVGNWRFSDMVIWVSIAKMVGTGRGKDRLLMGFRETPKLLRRSRMRDIRRLSRG